MLRPSIQPTSLKLNSECLDAGPWFWISLAEATEQNADTPNTLNIRLLRAGDEGPRRRAAQQRDELAPPHSMTSSPRASSDGGTVRPNAFAVFPPYFISLHSITSSASSRNEFAMTPLTTPMMSEAPLCVGCTARSPEPEFLVGSSVNAAVANFSKGLSKLGIRDGINVNVIHPGNTRTERQQERLTQRAQATGVAVEELRAAALTKSGIRRFGEVEDIAALTLFLCSKGARHIQGTAIAVDGGATVGYY